MIFSTLRSRPVRVFFLSCLFTRRLLRKILVHLSMVWDMMVIYMIAKSATVNLQRSTPPKFIILSTECRIKFCSTNKHQLTPYARLLPFAPLESKLLLSALRRELWRRLSTNSLPLNRAIRPSSTQESPGFVPRKFTHSLPAARLIDVETFVLEPTTNPFPAVPFVVWHMNIYIT